VDSLPTYSLPDLLFDDIDEENPAIYLVPTAIPETVRQLTNIPPQFPHSTVLPVKHIYQGKARAFDWDPSDWQPSRYQSILLEGGSEG
jgi:hypothetical protein